MMPPTSIDGTDITGATIDGTDVPPAAQIFQPVSGDENAFSGEYDIAEVVSKNLPGGGGNALRFLRFDGAFNALADSGLPNLPSAGMTIKSTVRIENSSSTVPHIGIGDVTIGDCISCGYRSNLFFIKQGNFGGGEIVASDSITTTLGDDYELSLTLFNDSSVEASINDFNTTLSTISVGPQNAPGNTPSLSLGTNRLSFTDTEVFYANCRSIVL
jgi:hypothetical protein